MTESESDTSNEQEDGRHGPVLFDADNGPDAAVKAFAEALGAPPDVADYRLPFRDRPDEQASPSTYVLHDLDLLKQVRTGLEGKSDVAIISPYGSGKTAIRQLIVRDFGALEKYIIADLSDAQAYTKRQLYVNVIRVVLSETDYTLDMDRYDGGSRTVDGPNGEEFEVPWATTECERALRVLTQQVADDGRRVVLAIDQIELMDAESYEDLKAVRNAGVQLVLLGSPRGRKRMEKYDSALADAREGRLTYIGRRIRPFDTSNIAEYAARSFAQMRGDPYSPREFQQGGDPWDDPSMRVFTPAAIEVIHDATDGHPRTVRKALNSVFMQAAEAWDDAGRPAIGDEWQADEAFVQGVVDQTDFGGGKDETTE